MFPANITPDKETDIGNWSDVELRSIKPVAHSVPDHVPPGSNTAEMYVYFGVYHKRAAEKN